MADRFICPACGWTGRRKRWTAWPCPKCGGEVADIVDYRENLHTSADLRPYDHGWEKNPNRPVPRFLSTLIVSTGQRKFHYIPKGMVPVDQWLRRGRRRPGRR